MFRFIGILHRDGCNPEFRDIYKKLIKFELFDSEILLCRCAEELIRESADSNKKLSLL